MRARILLPLMLLALGSALRPAGAQSLAAVARQEGERRKEVKEPAKTFTNQDLPNAPAPSSSAAAARDAASSDAGKPDAGNPDTAKPASSADAAQDTDKPKDQKYWAARIKTLRDTLEQDHVLADAMQTRVSSLEADFTSRDDPAQRSVVAQNRQKALDELARLKKAADADAKAIADLEEEARRAGVPPGWLR